MSGALTYQALNWGAAPRGIVEGFALGKGTICRPVGEVRAVSYAADKGNKPTIFRHEFDRRRDDEEGRTRYPYLLLADEAGEFCLGKVEAVQLGWLAIDCELVDGRVVAFGHAFLATNKRGSYCQLVFPRKGVPYALEQRGQTVTIDGIER